MANLKEVRARIASVQNTSQITKAMKLVSASKLKRAQDRINQMRPYADKLYEMLENILDNVDTEELELQFNQEREVENVLIILMTSDKGLCGSFNSTLIKQAGILANEKYAGKNVQIMTVGKKGYDHYRRLEGMDIYNDYQHLFIKPDFTEASKACTYAMDAFLAGEFDRVEVVYARFKNAAVQIYEAEQFLPIKPFEKEEGAAGSDINADYIFQPKKEELITELVPKILKTQFYRFLLDNNASEHGSRMVAMEKATENANELLKELKLNYNRERQAAITTEILEIVGGAAALDAG